MHKHTYKSNSHWHDNFAGCLGKQPFNNRGDARKAAKGNVQPYKCASCGKFHIGRSSNH
jgi:hypothetical protein